MFNCTKITLVRLAALVWFAGFIILLFKGSGIIIETLSIGAPLPIALGAAAAGVALGKIKAKYLFTRACEKNLNRIYALNSPRIWQFYRTPFFFFLFLMIAFGNIAYSLSKDSVAWLLALALLELSISTALLISAQCFKNRFRS